MTDKLKITAIILCVIVAVLSVTVFVALITGGEQNKVYGEFVPPSFDDGAIVGKPDIDAKDLGYTEVYSEGMPYKAYVCGKIKLYNEKYADIYFTNAIENEAWLKIRVLTDKGEIIAESGLIRPGEYLKTIEFDTVPKVGSSIKIKIMSYEPNTYHSLGAVTLNTKIGG